MSSSNRRSEDRIDVRMPIRFRPITTPPSAEQSAESVNISEHGLCFSTQCPLQVGEKVEIYLRMPQELSRNLIQVRWNARVVHVAPNGIEGKNGIGVQVETYEPIVEREGWVC
jgi:c-di-GMP-binding flagellar brake protein YcgR